VVYKKQILNADKYKHGNNVKFIGMSLEIETSLYSVGLICLNFIVVAVDFNVLFLWIINIYSSFS
jgi:hypothetical protein